MTNEPKLAPKTPAPNAANHADKSGAPETKPSVAAPAAAPVVPPVETKKI